MTRTRQQAKELSAEQRKLLTIIGNKEGINGNEFGYLYMNHFGGKTDFGVYGLKALAASLITEKLAIQHGNNIILTDLGKERYWSYLEQEGRPNPKKVAEFLGTLLARHEVRKHNRCKDGNGLTQEGLREFNKYMRRAGNSRDFI